jgi:hypothetical protein
MSAEAVGWVWKHSPYRGAILSVHLAVADVVNDLHDYEFWMSMSRLAAKARVSRPTASEAIGSLRCDGFVAILDAPVFGGSEPVPGRYRFLFPKVAVVFESKWLVGSDDKGLVSQDDKGLSAQTTGLVGSDDTNPKGTQGEPKRARREKIPNPFKLRDEDFDWARTNASHVDLDAATKEFVTYWRGDGRPKADWHQTWRNHMLKSEQRTARQGAAKAFL